MRATELLNSWLISIGAEAGLALALNQNGMCAVRRDGGSRQTDSIRTPSSLRCDFATAPVSRHAQQMNCSWEHLRI